MKKCIPTTRCGDEIAAAISVTESADVLVARIASGLTMSWSSAKNVLLRAELLDDRLDHEIALGEVGEIGGEPHTAERSLARLRGHLLLVHLALEEVRDLVAGFIAQIRGDLAADGLVACFDRQLCNPCAHRAETDHADAADLGNRHAARS